MHLVANHVVSGVLGDGHRLALLLHQLFEKALPHSFAVCIGERRVVDHYVDARDEGLIEGAHSVSSKKEDPLVVFKRPKESSYQIVTRKVLDLSMFHVYVRLVYQHDRAPAGRDLEPALQPFLYRLGVCADIGTCQGEQRPLCMCRDALWWSEVLAINRSFSRLGEGEYTMRGAVYTCVGGKTDLLYMFFQRQASHGEEISTLLLSHLQSPQTKTKIQEQARVSLHPHWGRRADQ